MLHWTPIKRGRRKKAEERPGEKARINENIRAAELRVVGADGANLGVLSRDDALAAAKEAELDLIEIAENAKPPVAKIMDYGKYQYEQKKKHRDIKAKQHVTETKSAQVKVGTGEHDKELKAKRIAAWLEEGNRVKVDLFLWGRYKYMEFPFLKERLENFLKLIPAEYKVADEMKKSPKGLTVIIEPSGGGKKKAEEGTEEGQPAEQTEAKKNHESR